MSEEKLLVVDKLRTEFFQSKKSSVTAINEISFYINKGEIVGLVGESGCGKSVTSLSIMRLLNFTSGKVTKGEVLFEGTDLQKLSEKEMRQVRGGKMSMIFQEPMSSLNPAMRIDKQLIEQIRLHTDYSKEKALERAAEMLKLVGIPDPPRVLKNYPHQLSGGMSQRVMIAMAMSCNPQLLIADEPTTALDVTIQAQIIELLLELQQKENMALVLITHDLALVAEAAHKIIVMYAGQVVETGDAHAIFQAPRHPYTQALLRALPEFAQDKERLASLPGVVPGKYDRPNGCLLNPRCPYATDKCRAEEPALNMLADGRQSKCHYPLDDAGRPTL